MPFKTDPAQIHDITVACKLHFTSEKYNAYERNFKVKSPKYVEDSPHYFLILPYARRFNVKEYTSYAMINCAYGNTFYAQYNDELFHEVSNILNSFSYKLKQCLKKFEVDSREKFDIFLHQQNDELPPILKESGFPLEFKAAINYFVRFTSTYKNDPLNRIQKKCLTIDRYTDFIARKIQREKVKKTLLDTLL